jgi:transketolase
MLHTAFKVAKELEAVGYSVGLIDLIDLTFFDRAAFLEEINSYSLLVSMEEGFKARGGLDALIFNLLSCFQSPAKLLNIGVEGGYRFELGTRSELHEQVGIGAQIALEKIKVFLGYYLKRDK